MTYPSVAVHVHQNNSMRFQVKLCLICFTTATQMIKMKKIKIKSLINEKYVLKTNLVFILFF